MEDVLVWCPTSTRLWSESQNHSTKLLTHLPFALYLIVNSYPSELPSVTNAFILTSGQYSMDERQIQLNQKHIFLPSTHYYQKYKFVQYFK